ncbi:MAG: DNA-formamidopyrimidine glycosylase family protein [Actinomycetota bacterium]
MPEYPDVINYLEALERHVVGHPIEKIRITGISVLKSFDPPINTIEGMAPTGTRRLGKRLVLEFEDDLFLVIHLMVAGRLFWRDAGAKGGKIQLAAIDFEHGTLVLNEAATKKRASMWLLRGEEQLLADHDRGGLEPLEIDLATFSERLTAQNRTLKRALTMPAIFSGIGNAYSDEILLHAKLSPVKRTGQLKDDEIERLYGSVQSTLVDFADRMRAEIGDGFPEKVTAFRKDMGVHGKFGEPCPVCGSPVQRIVYASNEVNYCATCQTEGRMLADRSLSRLLKDDWPKTIEELDGQD